VYIRFFEGAQLSKWRQKRSVMRRYDVTAQMYDARYAEEQEAKYKVALTGLNVAGAVLDVGCGTGLLFSHVAAQAEVVVGVDVSGKLLLQAKERTKSFRNAHVVQADADHLPFRSECFAVVFAFTMLQNMPKPAETLTELKRTAKRNGAIVVTGLKKAFPLEAFRELLRQADLRVISVKDDDVLKCYVAISAKRS
jgi:ubiquinone/menaquinone biosynthesis C-methylase UbiE